MQLEITYISPITLTISRRILRPKRPPPRSVATGTCHIDLSWLIYLHPQLLHHMGLRPYDKPFEYRYSKPTYYQGLLPLDYYVTKLTMPRRYIASYVVPCTWCPLTTYHDKTFCRLVMSPKNIVEEIVVVTKNVSIETNFTSIFRWCYVLSGHRMITLTIWRVSAVNTRRC